MAGDAEGDAAGFVDLVVADPVVRVAAAVFARGGLGQGRVDGRGGRSVRERAVRPLLVVDRGELIEEGLQLRERGGLLGLGAEPLLQGLLEPFDLPAGGGVVRATVLLLDVEGA